MAVHLTIIKNLRPMPATGAPVNNDSVGQIADITTAIPLDVTIGAAAVQFPLGTVAVTMHETEGTAFRYATGDSNVTVPAAPNAHRWTQYMGRLTVGVNAGDWFRTAAAS